MVLGGRSQFFLRHIPPHLTPTLAAVIVQYTLLAEAAEAFHNLVHDTTVVNDVAHMEPGQWVELLVERTAVRVIDGRLVTAGCAV